MSFEIVKPKNKDTYVPSRFKQPNVDRFVPIIKEVLSQHAQTGAAVVKFKNADLRLNPNTCLCRLRDAANSILRGITFHEQIDADVLKQVWWRYKVSYDNLEQTVVISPRQDLAETPMIADYISPTVLVEDAHFDEKLKALAFLLGHYVFRGKVTIVGMLSDTLKEELQKQNVFINQVKPNEHIMV